MMPLTVEPLVVRRALTAVGAADPEAGRDVEHVLDVLGGREHATQPLKLSRHGVQLFLWYRLPRKYLAPLEHKHALRVALARFFDALGDSAAGYAALCRSADTAAVLDAYERDPQGGHELMCRLIEQSGLEPPDTPALSWGATMGLQEAREHEAVALLLDEAIDDGRLVPGAPGSARRRAALVQEHLGAPRPDLHGCTPIEVIEAERLERFINAGSPERRALLEPVADDLRVAAVPSGEEAAFEPLRWLLAHAETGLPLTQTGALARAVVREGASRFDGWWREDIHGPPHREDDVAALGALRELARRARLVRRRARKLVLTKRGMRALGDPGELARAACGELLAPDGFEAAVHELACAALLTTPETSWRALTATTRRAIVADGWHSSDGEPPDTHAVSWTLGGLLTLARALALTSRDLSSDSLDVTADGHMVLRYALRRRATAPASR